MKSIIKKSFHGSPSFYGLWYILFIPIYATLYYLFPHTLNQDITITDALYFSTITITTLGYGDFAPITDLGKILTASESIFGIIIIGLFLNALSRERIEEIREKEKEKEKKRYREKEISKLNGHSNILFPLIENYYKSVSELTNIDHNNIYRKNFKFSEMYQLYNNVYISSESFNKPEVKYYFETLHKLNHEITELIKSVDLRLFSNLEKDCIAFLHNTHSFDYSDFIIKSRKSKIGDKRLEEIVKEKIKNYNGNPKSIDNEKDELLKPYIALYFQIKSNMIQIDIIQKDLNDLKLERNN